MIGPELQELARREANRQLTGRDRGETERCHTVGPDRHQRSCQAELQLVIARAPNGDEPAGVVAGLAHQLRNGVVETGRLDGDILEGQRPESQPIRRLGQRERGVEEQLTIHDLGGDLSESGQGELVGGLARREFTGLEATVLGERE